MMRLRAASRSVPTAAWRGNRAIAAWVTPTSWSIVSLVMTGPSSLSRESRPAHQPIPPGLGARLGQPAVDNSPPCRRVLPKPLGPRTQRRSPTPLSDRLLTHQVAVLVLTVVPP